MYKRFLDDLKKINPHLRVAGYTATEFRTDSGMLHEGDDAMFDGIAYKAEIKQLMDDGYLCPLTSQQSSHEIDTSKVHTSGGDFNPKELEAAAMDPDSIRAIADSVAMNAEGRKGILVFGSGVKHTTALCDALRERGIQGEVAFGDTDRGERNRFVSQFKSQRIRLLGCYGLFTTGFNARHVDMIVMARATKSRGLYIQIAGRGTRTFPGKKDCVAEGSLILTDTGLVPIENVTMAMKIWDGCNFVTHDGIVFKGEQEVISYAGLTATSDHNVWTKEGWKAFGECADKQIPISVTGNGRAPIREAYGNFRGGYSDWARPSFNYRMPEVRIERIEGISQSRFLQSGMQGMRETESCPEVAYFALKRSETTMRKSARWCIRAIRSAWNRISLRWTYSGWFVDNGTSWLTQGFGDRPHRQRRSLRAWQSEMVNENAEFGSHSENSGVSCTSCVQNEIPGSPICGQHPCEYDISRHDGARDCRTMGRSVMQAKRRVWDILNCGPLHRFTASGLLVHNCLFLDFGGNIARHGPIDNMNPIKSKKGTGGTAPYKLCPNCGEENHTVARFCVKCDFAFPDPESKVATEASTLDIMSRGDQTPEWIDVTSVVYDRHSPRDTSKPNSLKVTYRCGLLWHSEWICLEHTGIARGKAVSWWKRRAPAGTSVPATIGEALDLTLELDTPHEICVRPDGKFMAITGHRHFTRDVAFAA